MKNDTRLVIRLATESDMPMLVAEYGDPEFHKSQLAKQAKDECLYLVAMLGDDFVGHAFLRRESYYAPVRKRLSDYAELDALDIHKSEMRSKGYGSQIVAECERLARDWGVSKIGLAVSVKNTRAESLYYKLGYRDWGYGTFPKEWVDEGGVRHQGADLRYLVKSLR